MEDDVKHLEDEKGEEYDTRRLRDYVGCMMGDGVRLAMVSWWVIQFLTAVL